MCMCGPGPPTNGNLYSPVQEGIQIFAVQEHGRCLFPGPGFTHVGGCWGLGGDAEGWAEGGGGRGEGPRCQGGGFRSKK